MRVKVMNNDGTFRYINVKGRYASSPCLFCHRRVHSKYRFTLKIKKAIHQMMHVRRYFKR